jgi:hypothetical protein
VLNNVTLPAPDRAELVAFQKKTAKLVRAIQASQQLLGNLEERVQYLKQAINNTPDATPDLLAQAAELVAELDDIRWAFYGQTPKASREENWPAPPAINDRIGALIYSHWNSTSRVSETQMQMYDILAEEFPPLLEEMKTIAEESIPAIEAELDALNAPWTPGRIPEWKE